VEWYGNGNAEALLARSPWGPYAIAAVFEKVVRSVLCDDRDPSLVTLLSSTLRSIKDSPGALGDAAGLSSSSPYRDP
jgi:hypothetical protein